MRASISGVTVGIILSTMSAVAAPSKPALVPLASDGHPSLEGMWTSSTATPLERPADVTSNVLTSDQAAAAEKRAEDFRTHKSFKANEVGHDNEAFLELNLKVLPSMQSSLIVTPADGKLPLRPEAERARDFNLSNFDSFERMSPWDRCITRGPLGLVPSNYNNGYQIVQTPRYVMIMAEMIHEARVIPLDSGAHADARVRTWAGDSRGHWEGKTLAVETTNFHDHGWIATHSGGGRLRGVPHSAELRTVERFTRVDAQTIRYEITIEDPQTFTQPWTIAFPFTRDDGYRIYEYACVEGNSAVEAILRGARAQERGGG